MSEQKEEQIEQQAPVTSVDLDNLPKQQHKWVDRGLKVTCETNTHPSHDCWKRRTIQRCLYGVVNSSRDYPVETPPSRSSQLTVEIRNL